MIIRTACRPWWVTDQEWIHFADHGLVGNPVPTLLDVHVYFIRLHLRVNLTFAIFASIIMFVPLLVSTVFAVVLGALVSYLELVEFSPFKRNYITLIELEKDIRNDMMTK